MKAYTRIFFLLFFLFSVTACVPAATSTQVTITEEAQPTSDAQYHPLDTRTGITEIDTVLAAVESDDPQSLRDMFSYTKTSCMTVNALGGPPPCPEGEAEGTAVEVLPVLGPEGSYLYKDEISNWPGLDVEGIHAIYNVSENAYSDEYYPKGDYGIVLIGKKGIDENVILQVKEGVVVRIDYIFDLSTDMLAGILERNAAELVLAPIE